MTDLLLIRHGQSTWNAQRRWAGSADPPLSEKGEAESRDLATGLAGLGVGAVVTSDLVRSRRTGEIVAATLGLPEPGTERLIRERDVGQFSGLTADEIEELYGEGTIERYRRHELMPPGAERFSNFCARVLDGLRRIGAQHPEGRVLVVAHGGVLRAVEYCLETDVVTKLANLSGRWVHVEGTVLRAGPCWPEEG